MFSYEQNFDVFSGNTQHIRGHFRNILMWKLINIYKDVSCCC